MSIFDTKFKPSPITFGNSSSSKPTTKSSTDWMGLGLAGVQTIGGIFSSSETKKGLQAQADALIAQGKSQEEVARIMLEAEKLKLEQIKAGAGIGTQTGGSKTLYIALAIGGVVILGAVIFAVTRKK
jgi:hypothetical protein